MQLQDRHNQQPVGWQNVEVGMLARLVNEAMSSWGQGRGRGQSSRGRGQGRGHKWTHKNLL